MRRANPLRNTMLKRRVLPLLLAFFMLLSQQMGMAHIYSHFTPNTAPVVSHDEGLGHGQLCSQCAAYASIGSALPHPPLPDLPGQQAASTAVDVPASVFSSRTILAFESRAPPVLFS